MTYVTAEELEPGDVIQRSAGAAWRTVVDVRPPTHPAAEHTGFLVVDVALWRDGRPMPPMTLGPNERINRVRTRAEDLADWTREMMR